LLGVALTKTLWNIYHVIGKTMRDALLKRIPDAKLYQVGGICTVVCSEGFGNQFATYGGHLEGWKDISIGFYFAEVCRG
jgi:hypothetical protein